MKRLNAKQLLVLPKGKYHVAMGCIFLFRGKEKANGAFAIEHTKNQEKWGWVGSQTSPFLMPDSMPLATSNY